MSIAPATATEKLPLKRLMSERGSVFGTMVFEFFVPGLPAIAASAGSDFLLLDMEHTGASFETIKAQCAACRGVGISPIVRIPVAEYHFVARALDVGAHGVMVPMVESPEQAQHIVSCATYPPRGRRGAAFTIAHDDYLPGTPTAKMASAAERTIIIPQIETPTGVQNVDAIAAVPGVDIVWLGHFDLTNFMGIPGDFDHPDYRRAVDAIVAAAGRHGKVAGFMATDERWASEYWDLGFRAIAYGLDHLLYQQALMSGISVLKGKEGQSR